MTVVNYLIGNKSIVFPQPLESVRDFHACWKKTIILTVTPRQHSAERNIAARNLPSAVYSEIFLISLIPSSESSTTPPHKKVRWVGYKLSAAFSTSACLVLSRVTHSYSETLFFSLSFLCFLSSNRCKSVERIWYVIGGWSCGCPIKADQFELFVIG